MMAEHMKTMQDGMQMMGSMSGMHGGGMGAMGGATAVAGFGLVDEDRLFGVAANHPARRERAQLNGQVAEKRDSRLICETHYYRGNVTTL